MSRRSCLPGCFTMLALASMVAGGAYLYLRGQLPWQKFTPAAAARVIPESAVATGFINTDPQEWSALAKYVTPNAREKIARALARDDLNYQNDLQPWIGGVTVAFLPTSGQGVGPLLAVGIKDKIKALEFYEKQKQRADRTFTESDHGGVKITRAESKRTSEEIYSAVVGDFLLVGGDRAVVEAGIDTYRGKPSFASKSEVQKLLDRPLELENPLARVVIDNYAGVVTSGLKASGIDLPQESLSSLAQVRGMVAGLGAKGDRLHFQGLTQMDPATFSKPTSTSNEHLLSLFPSDTIFLITGNDLGRAWKDADRQTQSDPRAGEAIARLRAMVRMGGIDLDRDVFGWMDRGFAFGVLSNRASGKEEGGFLFVWDTGDPKTARESLEKLERLREFFGSISSEKISTDGREVTRWQAEGRTILTHGWLDNDSLFVALGVSYAGRPDSPITANPNFQRAIEGFPKNGFGYFFLDVERFLEMSAASPDLSNRVPLDPSGRALLESVRAVGSTASWVDATTSQVDISVLLK